MTIGLDAPCVDKRVDNERPWLIFIIFPRVRYEAFWRLLDS